MRNSVTFHASFPFQDPFPKFPPEFRVKLSEAERRALKAFLGAADVDAFSLELHEVLLLKTGGAAPQQRYHADWE